MSLVQDPFTGSKPAILCFHGGGTSSDIFRIQTAKLRTLLSLQFDFIFVDAPFPSRAGPGVLPIFEGLPFYTWAPPGKVNQVAPPETSILLTSVIAQEVKRNGQPFVGVMGFSFGAKVAAGLLLHQQEHNKLYQADNRFQFGIFLNGISPPLLPHALHIAETPLIHIPSVHVIGALDPYREESKALAAAFDRTETQVIEFMVDHRLPPAKDDNDRLAEEIKALYVRSRCIGRRGARAECVEGSSFRFGTTEC